MGRRPSFSYHRRDMSLIDDVVVLLVLAGAVGMMAVLAPVSLILRFVPDQDR